MTCLLTNRRICYCNELPSFSEHDAERGRARCSEPRQQPPEWGGSCSGKPKGECSHSDPTTLATEAARFTWACVTILQGLAVCLVDLVERMMCFPSQFTPTARFWQIPMCFCFFIKALLFLTTFQTTSEDIYAEISTSMPKRANGSLPKERHRNLLRNYNKQTIYRVWNEWRYNRVRSTNVPISMGHIVVSR